MTEKELVQLCKLGESISLPKRENLLPKRENLLPKRQSWNCFYYPKGERDYPKEQATTQKVALIYSSRKWLARKIFLPFFALNCTDFRKIYA